MMRLKINLISIALVILAALAMSPAQARMSLDQRVDAATEVLQQLSRIPEQSIPPTLLQNAYAIAVIPNQIKAGFFIGGSYGKGILVVRRPDGRWSNPSFISMGAGSIGWQIGAQASDIILVFKSRKGVDDIARGKFTLGADANVAAGPVGRRASAATDVQLKAEIYAYSRTRGLFAGISLEGSVIRIDQQANLAYYGAGTGDAAKILSDAHMPTPAHARRFIEVLTAKAPRLQWQTGSRTAANVDAGAKTFAIGNAPAAASPDTTF